MAGKSRMSAANRDSIAREIQGSSLEKLCRHTLLSKAETYRLIKKAQKGCQESFNALAKHNVRMVVGVARRYMNWHSVPLVDLVGDGFIGLVIAVMRFKTKMGYSLSTYATWWIRHEILRSIANTSRSIRVPVHGEDLLTKIRKVRSKIAAMEGREEPTLDELMPELDLKDNARTRARVTELILWHLRREPTSLNVPVHQHENDGTPTELIDLLDLGVRTPLDEALRNDRIRVVREALRTLDPRERAVLERRYGIGGADPRTLQEIGTDEDFNVSRERIRQIETDAKKSLRLAIKQMRAV